MRKCVAVTLFLLFGLNLMAGPAAHAGPPAEVSSENYEKFVKDSYLPDRQGVAAGRESVAKETIRNTVAEKEATNLRGVSGGEAQGNAEYDELTIKQDQFFQCNDGRISIFGDPEARPPKPCQEEVGFFDRPNAISFMCPFGIFSNACGDDRATGFELGLLCAQDPRGCGVHYDNKHPGRGGGIGIAILSKKPAPPFSPCSFIYVTSTYVEYLFPWMMLNTSRQMYQSGYLDEGVSDGLRSTGQTLLRAAATVQTSSTVGRVAQSANNTVNELLGGSAGSVGFQANPQAGLIANEAALGLKAIDHKYRDLSPHGSRQYARNFSSTLDIRFMQPLYWFVPHFPLDTHRYGSEFPNLSTGIEIPTPTGTFIPTILTPMPDYRGGLLYGRFLSMFGLSGSARLQQQLGAFTSAKGATACLANNKVSGKTPHDFLPMVAAGKSPEKMCIDRVGPQFPHTSSSFSAHNTDAFWRGLQSAGLDLFYALNWSMFYDGNETAQESLARMAPVASPFHTYLEDYDRSAIMPNPNTTDPNFQDEIGQCGRLRDLADLNVNYRKANIHKPLWGAQNTAYVYALVKGAWAFRGVEPKFGTIEFGNTRHSEIEYRFR